MPLADLLDRFLARIEKRRVDEPFYRAIHRIADQMAPPLRDSFLRGVLAVVDQIDQPVLISAIEHGNLARALAAIPIEAFADTFSASGERILLETLQQAGRAATVPLSATHGVTMAFDLMNPRAQQWAATRTATLVTEVLAGDTGLRETLRGLLSRAFTEGIPPRVLAREIRQHVGLLPRDSRAVWRYRDTLLAAGRDPEFIERNTARYAQRLLNVRARNIARTETLASSNRGQQELWTQAVEQKLLTGRERRVWIVTPGSRLCPICESLEDVEATLDGEFAPGIVMPPDPHPSCRCAVGLLPLAV